MPNSIQLDLFDMAVRQGVRLAVCTLQNAVHEFEDGALGPRTQQAVQSMAVERMTQRFHAACRLWRPAHRSGGPSR